MDRNRLIADIRARLEGRQLVWFGTRGDDIEAVTEIPELTAAFSVVNAYGRRASISSLAFENLLRHRVDLDRHDIDDELGTTALEEFRRSILRVLSRPSALFTYRPSVLISAVCFARRDRCRHLGMFKDHQAAFEHKPWVESCIADLGLPHIPWTYVADEDQLETLRMMDEGPVMLRTSRSSGGTGLTLVENRASLVDAWPEQREAYVSVAPFIAGGVPVNVSAVVWRDGVTLHPGSLQLIGLPGLTSRPFGYCGNDFVTFGDLGDDVIEAIEAATLRIGRWLGGHGYRGAFGVDYLVKDGVALFTEVNPRFQGSTHASAQLAAEAGQSCVLLDHLAAHLDVEAPPSLSLREWVGAAGPLSHFVVHWLDERAVCEWGGELAAAVMADPDAARVDVVAPGHLPLDPGATVLRATVRTRVTDDGFRMTERWGDLVADYTAKVSMAGTGSGAN